MRRHILLNEIVVLLLALPRLYLPGPFPSLLARSGGEARHLGCKPGYVAVERHPVLRQPVQKADFERFLRVEEPAGEDHILHPRCADEAREPRQIGCRQAIPERSGDGKSEVRILRRDAQITAGGKSGAPSGACPRYDRNRRDLAEFSRAPMMRSMNDS